jgi:hypothetical protein
MNKAKRGRPKLDNPTSTHITIRLTIQDKENLKKLSEFHSLSIGAMIRKLATTEAQKIGL